MCIIGCMLDTYNIYTFLQIVSYCIQMICDLMTSLSIDMRTFMVREIKMEWDSLCCFLFFMRILLY